MTVSESGMLVVALLLAAMLAVAVVGVQALRYRECRAAGFSAVYCLR